MRVILVGLGSTGHHPPGGPSPRAPIFAIGVHIGVWTRESHGPRPHLDHEGHLTGHQLVHPLLELARQVIDQSRGGLRGEGGREVGRMFLGFPGTCGGLKRMGEQ